MTGTPAKRPAYEPAADLLQRQRYDPDMARPGTIVAGAVLVLLRVVAGLITILIVTLDAPQWSQDIGLAVDDAEVVPGATGAVLAVLASVVGMFLLADLIFAVFILRGRNWARVAVMVFSTLSITSVFAQWWSEDQEITINTSLLSVGLDILILLALSSRSAAAYARRNERPPSASD
ncbi:hypothetical protein [Microbacterium sp. NPDC064584]|uniref:hypothetical protein n=1 Tax=Microbacterium sp. NPDC064584 TaxID=3155817 RepID=UPI003416401B